MTQRPPRRGRTWLRRYWPPIVIALVLLALMLYPIIRFWPGG